MVDLEAPPVPRQISRSGERDVRIEWSDGHQSLYSARRLRLLCPCAMCVDELTGKKVLRDEEVAPEVGPVSLELVGRYALRVWFSDGHSSGIYSFKYLRRLCPCPTCTSSPGS